jgi:ABC-type multidrug transport system ATPase subunit
MDSYETPLSVEQITRRYGRRLALDRADLIVLPGQIVGLVGPNGSGKTTLLRTVAGFLRPSAGKVRVFGRDPFVEQAQVMQRARFAFAPPALFDELTPREHLHYLAGLNHASIGKTEIASVLAMVGLGERGGDRVGTFSFGMRQRVVLALALLPTPGLLVLDEPTDGLDPIGVLGLRELLLRLKNDHGVAILLSSHLLSEIEELADRLLVLESGKTLFYGDLDELTTGLERTRLRVSDLDASQAVLEAQGILVRRLADELELPVGRMDAQEAASILAAQGLRLLELRTHRPSLEEALLQRMQTEVVR